jgi:hypothetical protein
MSEVLEIDFEGKTYRASYSVTGDVVMVRAAYGTKSTQVGGLSAEQVARLLAMELIREAKGNGSG